MAEATFFLQTIVGNVPLCMYITTYEHKQQP